MTVKYILTETTYHSEEVNRIGYGMAAIIVEDGVAVVLRSANDLITDRLKAEELVHLCNEHQLSVKHLNDVVEDFIT